MISPRVNTRVLQRSISLLSPQAAKTESNVVTKERTYIENLNKDIATSRFRLVDENGKIASITVQPDIPICIKKDCLVSIHNLNHLSLSYKWLNFWSNLIKFRSFKSSLFHRIIGSSVLEILAAPNFQTSRRPFDSSRSLSNSSLEIKSPIFPSARSLVSNSSKSQLPRKFQILNGRGNVLVCGGGLVYSIELIDESDKILVNSRNILAINGQSQLDIANSVERQELHVEGAYVGDSSNDTVAPKFIKNQTLKSAYGHTVQFFKRMRSWIRNQYEKRYIYGVESYFMKIKGPRTILIQTHEMTTSKDNILTKLTFKGHVKKSNVNDNGVNLEKQVANDVNSKIIELANRPSLFIATVSQDGRVDFQSTSKFT
ncbi:ANM_HP_G0077610.mRNA.1.CDS.1 [Saccharomyces cerevisiae]|nr:ANM_HP_G0196100.mRNA.1.CDS.1 [Saccharomyces cerevisiae]CAI5156451.1 ANM_HP_G0233810.mRNA.1.CDS.1 [Saccharomyces cerevisiae]CAI5223128.1 ANM_HP_G0052540.mRNA.1.CDS.1 [Saccharomyces cerevisiae]CAI5225512.1 ANM_HP_G0074550.mRNA.1.CDS.1 [Saccharomyces cerevisiae]CAI5225818.1 ANM_HP_G0077610.mRNA.1.CDS.1 [Saccharomyces cerevisiae]